MKFKIQILVRRKPLSKNKFYRRARRGFQPRKTYSNRANASRAQLHTSQDTYVTLRLRHIALITKSMECLRARQLITAGKYRKHFFYYWLPRKCYLTAAKKV